MISVIKKLSLILCFAYGIANAGSMGPEESFLSSGFYLGADIGIADLVNKESTAGDHHHFSATGFVGGGLVGYEQAILEQLNIGLEFFANANAMNLSARQLYNGNPSYRASARYNLGLRLLPSYSFNPTTSGHVILGYSSGHFSVKDNGDYGVIDTQFYKNGFQSGFGLKTHLFPNIMLRGDVIYTTYSSAANYGKTPPNTLIYHNQFSTLESDLTLVYQF